VDAAAAMANRMTVVLTGSTVKVTDSADPIDASAPECSGGGTNTVECSFATSIARFFGDTKDLDDSLSVDAVQVAVLAGGDGSDEVTLATPPGLTGFASIRGDDPQFQPAGDGNDTLTGGGFGEFLNGQGGVDVLRGGGGDDNLSPDQGDGERAEGGSGDDRITYLLGDGTGDVFDGGDGIDALAVASQSLNGAATVDLGAGTVTQTAGGAGAVSALSFESVFGFGVALTVDGTDGPNQLVTSGAAGDLVRPGAGADRIDAGDGPDRVLTRDGFGDSILCGAGTDSVEADQFDELVDCEEVSVAQVRPAGVDLDAPGCNLAGVRKRMTRKRLLGRGVGAAAECDEAVSLQARLTAPVRARRGGLVTARAGQIVLAERTLPLAEGARRLRLRVPRGVRRALGRRFTATLSVVARDQFGNRRTITRRVRVR
jgi:hypothetical protein